MNPYWQSAVVYALVLWCLWRVLRRYAPSTSWRWQARFSYALESSRSGLLRRIGLGLRPAVSIPASCDAHCRTCRRCA